jgi:hypothetical protein
MVAASMPAQLRVRQTTRGFGRSRHRPGEVGGILLAAGDRGFMGGPDAVEIDADQDGLAPTQLAASSSHAT